MSVESMAIALHHSRARGTAKVVLLGIANHDGDGGAFPKIATLAKYANVHPRRVVEALNTLGQLGEIVIKHRDGGTARMPEHQRPNLYELVLACPADCDRTKNHRLEGEKLGRNYAGQQDPDRVKDPAAVARGKAARAKHLANLAAIAATVLPGDENSTSDENSTTPSVVSDTTPSVENDTTKNHPMETPREISFAGTSPGAGVPVDNSEQTQELPAQRRPAAGNGATKSPRWSQQPTAEEIERTRRGAAAARAALRGQHAAAAAGAPAGEIKEVASLSHDHERATA